MGAPDDRKYELVAVPDDDRFRVRALRDWTLHNGTKVSKGDIGGWVDGYYNLDQAGRCWIADDASATDTARVIEDALMSDQAIASGTSVLSGRSHVWMKACLHNARIQGEAQMWGDAAAHGGALISGRASLGDRSKAFGPVEITDDVTMYGHSCVQSRARASGSVILLEHANVGGQCQVTDEVEIRGRVRMWDSARASGRARLGGDAVLCERSHATDDSVVGGDAFLQGDDVADGSMVLETRRWRDSAPSSDFDASGLDATQLAALGTCGAPTGDGKCRHRVRPETTRCPAGHQPVA